MARTGTVLTSFLFLMALLPVACSSGSPRCNDQVMARFQNAQVVSTERLGPFLQEWYVIVLGAQQLSGTDFQWSITGRGSDGCVAVLSASVNGIRQTGPAFYTNLTTGQVLADNEVAKYILSLWGSFFTFGPIYLAPQ
jgi:hypothetical protein